MLPDLPIIIMKCKNDIRNLDLSKLETLNTEDWENLKNSISKLYPNSKITQHGDQLEISFSGSKTFTLVESELPKLAILTEHYAALEIYRDQLNAICSAMRKPTRVNDTFFKRLPADGSKTWRTNPPDSDEIEFDKAVNTLFRNKNDQSKILNFVSDKNWCGGAGRKFNRAQDDWMESALLKVGGLVAASNAGRDKIVAAILDSGLCSRILSPSISTNTIKGENVIFYGAPGTGKSYKVRELIKGNRYVRTVFHPDLQNSDFFGCLKPRMNGTDVEYRFIPGPFMKAFALAIKEPDKPVYLVIEELNRAPAAAVFGDLFLLLDRGPDGLGEYDVDFPTEESGRWLCEQEPVGQKKLQLPSNLFICATMNSADQGVYPIDTAFRRRWRHEYLPINYEDGTKGKVAYTAADLGPKTEMNWQEFVKVLNEFLLESNELEIAEDRLLGQWFVKNYELDGKSIPEKVLVYLWDDLLRHEDRKLIFSNKIRTYGTLAKRIDENKVIFSKMFLNALDPLIETGAFAAPENDTDVTT